VLNTASIPLLNIRLSRHALVLFHASWLSTKGNPNLQLDDTHHVIHYCITMQPTASVRDLRNHFPKVRKILESEGEVLLTESGTARYRLTPYSSPKTKVASTVNYWARLTTYQPEPISAEAAKALDEVNRGNR